MGAPTRHLLVRVFVTVVLLGTGGAVVPLAQAGQPQPLEPAVPEQVRPRAEVPEDRYAMAGGCYALQDATSGRWVQRSGSGFAATAEGLASAEPFHLQATDLGSYLLFGTRKDFLAGQDAPTDAVAPGTAVVAAGRAGPDADFTATDVGAGSFLFVLAPRRQALAVLPSGALQLAAADGGSAMALRRTSGCATWPEISTNVRGEPARASTAYQEARGYLDAHVHGMAYEFLGGKARCGRPWSPYGVTQALVDCPDHGPDGRTAALETVLSGSDPAQGHDTVGWPTFQDWPRNDSLTHEQVYVKWLERSWRGGLRMMTNLLVDNAALCKLYPLKQNSCNEMDGVRLQAQRLQEFERYIDAQSGGPGEGWFRIVRDPFQAREVINSGRLAVVMGIEVSTLFDCGLVAGVPLCDRDQIDRQLQEVYDLGVRQMEMANKFDNALTGVTGDGGTTGVIVNNGNKEETGQYWQMSTCPAVSTADEPQPEDRRQLNLADDSGAPPPLGGRDSIFAGALGVTGTTGAAPVYPPGPHCNVRGLSDLGSYLLEQMMQRGMLFDPDHMSAKARTAAMDLVQQRGYDGVVSSHSWSDDTIYPKVLEAEGLVTPYAGNSTSFVQDWAKTREWARDRTQYWGLGWGADTNGFGAQGARRAGAARNPVTYPFRGLGGVVVDKQISGERTYDINDDGVAHYGLYPDWVEDLRMIAGDGIVEDLERGAEAYLQMWERATGVPERRCRDAAELRGGTGLGALRPGMTAREALQAAGQPAERTAVGYTWCVSGRPTGVTARLDDSGRVTGVDASR